MGWGTWAVPQNSLSFETFETFILTKLKQALYSSSFFHFLKSFNFETFRGGFETFKGFLKLLKEIIIILNNP